MFNVVVEENELAFDSGIMPSFGGARPMAAPGGPRPIAMPQSNRVGISQPTSSPVAFEIRKIFPETWMFDSFDLNDT